MVKSESSRRSEIPIRRDDVVDTLHGVSVPHPYRWLEDGVAEETSAWTVA
jgi:prolyl oligopeptidase